MGVRTLYRILFESRLVDVLSKLCYVVWLLTTREGKEWMKGGKSKEEVYVLDTSAIIKGFVPPDDAKCYTVPEVVSEVRDDISRARLSSYNVMILEPKDWAVRRVKRMARLTGDLEKLSDTDVKVLALAVILKDRMSDDVHLVTTDYAMQNVASNLGIEIVPLYDREIDEVIGPGENKWKK
ncbi:MAG: ribonuclease VapC [Methanopyri archaeon]|nr:ribonuclease VapC [Methanopyri archaeon]